MRWDTWHVCVTKAEWIMFLDHREMTSYLKVFGCNAVILRLDLSQCSGEIWELIARLYLASCWVDLLHQLLDFLSLDHNNQWNELIVVSQLLWLKATWILLDFSTKALHVRFITAFPFSFSWVLTPCCCFQPRTPSIHHFQLNIKSILSQNSKPINLLLKTKREPWCITSLWIFCMKASSASSCSKCFSRAICADVALSTSCQVDLYEFFHASVRFKAHSTCLLSYRTEVLDVLLGFFSGFHSFLTFGL